MADEPKCYCAQCEAEERRQNSERTFKLIRLIAVMFVLTTLLWSIAFCVGRSVGTSARDSGYKACVSKAGNTWVDCPKKG